MLYIGGCFWRFKEQFRAGLGWCVGEGLLKSGLCLGQRCPQKACG